MLTDLAKFMLAKNLTDLRRWAIFNKEKINARAIVRLSVIEK